LALIAFGSPSMGRTFAHTLLFLMLLSFLCIYFRDIRLISITWGVFCHLCLDFMWNSPKILFWPLLGPFPDAPLLDTMSYLEMLLSGLKYPSILIPEIAGLSYLIVLAYSTRRQILAEIDHHLWKKADRILKNFF
jgi:membrane-bound metal-dependent hydrolase YbcI (DUF457 family)